MSNDAYVSFLGDQPRTSNGKKKIVLGALAAVGVVGVVAAVFAFSGSASPSSNSMYAANVLSNDEVDMLFKRFIQEHGKQYSGAEYYERFLTFKRNLEFIRLHNEQGYAYKLGVNQFADMTRDEIRSKHLGLAARPLQASNFLKSSAPVDVAALPKAVDWYADGKVQAPKNQGRCGSCWAFATTAVVESIHAIKKGDLPSLSEQQLVDCSSAFGNQGCKGGFMDNAYKYIVKHGGLASSTEYLYNAKDEVCKDSQYKSVASIDSFSDVEENNEDSLLAAVAQQPVAVAIQADQMDFQMYQSGVFDGPCGTDLDHGVVIVGYGTEEGKDFWLVKNSWGEKWGDKGFIKLVRRGGKGQGQCGLAMAASYPIIN